MIRHIVMFILCMYIISIFTPIIYSFYIIIPFVLGLLFLVLTFGKFIKFSNSLLICIITFLAISIFYRLIGYSTASLGNYVNKFLFVVSVWAGFYLWNCCNNKERLSILYILLISITVNLIYGMQIRFAYPELDQTLKQDVTEIYGMLNLGSTEFTYCCLFAIIFVYLSLKKSTSFSPIIPRYITFILFCIYSYYLVVFGQSATAILTFLFFIAALSVFGKQNRYISAFIICALIVLLISTIFLKDEIIRVVTEVAGEKIGIRVAALLHPHSMSDDEQVLFVRFPLIMYDLRMWCSDLCSFVFGWGYHLDDGANLMDFVVKNKCGNHSAIFDILPRYGLVGLFFTLHILKYAYKYFVGLFNRHNRFVGILIFYIIVFSNIMNVTLYHNVAFVWFFMYPFFTQKVQTNTY